MTQHWRKFFPLSSPRLEQERVLDEIVERIDSGDRTIILEAGTGVGKSAIAVCVANYVASLGDRGEEYQPGAYVLTSQKILQDQYIRDFRQAADIRSSANFKCTDGPGETCGQTTRYVMYRSRNEEPRGPATCPGCPYRTAKDRFIGAPLGVTNYSYFLSETVYAGQLEPRELLVLDEAHNIEAERRRWATVELDEETATRVGASFPFSGKRVETIDWMVSEYRPALQRYILKLSSKLDDMERKGIKKGLTLLIDELDRLDRHVCSLNRILTEGEVSYDMLIDWEEQQNGVRKLKVQPLDAGQIAKDILYPHGQRVLLMSATVLSEGIFRKAAGVSGGAFVSCPTPFAPSSFGIVYRPVGRMARAHLQRTLPKMTQAVRQILRSHPTEKGIIHCSNYEVTRAISAINDRRLLIQTNARDREEMLRRHRTSREPTVLVSPSMMEGLDLEGDFGRFQVICKVPFPNMGDPVVEAKRRTGDDWYAWITARTLIQAVGRCVRSMEDSTRTYVLDESFGQFFEQWAELFPHYFSEMEVDV